MKRNRKRIITIGIVLVLVVASAFVMYTQGLFGSKQSASASSYEVVKLSTGDLQKSITGSGTLSTQGSASETAPLDLTIDTVLVEAGQGVIAGEALATVDTSALKDTILTLRSEISSIDSTLAQEASQKENTLKVTSQVAGRVKQIIAQKGDDVKSVSTQSGGLLVLSTDGLMKLTCKLDTANSLSSGDSVVVKTNGKSYSGLVGVVAADGSSCTVTLTDNGPALGAEAIVYLDGDQVGSGTLEINQPYTVTADGGIVYKVYVKENQKVTTRTNLFYLKSVPVSDDYANQLQTRAQKVALLQQALAIEESGVITAAQDGVVDTISMKDGGTVAADGELLTLLTGGTVSLTVSVDELDISTVQIGQAASVAVDAIEGQSYDGTVESISQVGSSSNGVTTYSVNIALEGDDALKIGMNATATIVIEERKDVLLLPLEALQSTRGEQYVWLYTGELPTDASQNPGTRTVVETGLSDDENVEIVSGLTQEDQVVVVRTKSSNSSGSQQGNMEFPGMSGGMSAGQVGGGGQMGEPPSGSGNRRN